MTPFLPLVCNSADLLLRFWVLAKFQYPQFFSVKRFANDAIAWRETGRELCIQRFRLKIRHTRLNSSLSPILSIILSLLTSGKEIRNSWHIRCKKCSFILNIVWHYVTRRMISPSVSLLSNGISNNICQKVQFIKFWTHFTLHFSSELAALIHSRIIILKNLMFILKENSNYLHKL